MEETFRIEILREVPIALNGLNLATLRRVTNDHSIDMAIFPTNKEGLLYALTTSNILYKLLEPDTSETITTLQEGQVVWLGTAITCDN